MSVARFSIGGRSPFRRGRGSGGSGAISVQRSLGSRGRAIPNNASLARDHHPLRNLTADQVAPRPVQCPIGALRPVTDGGISDRVAANLLREPTVVTATALSNSFKD